MKSTNATRRLAKYRATSCGVGRKVSGLDICGLAHPCEKRFRPSLWWRVAIPR
jgi:hypothetical protein